MSKLSLALKDVPNTIDPSLSTFYHNAYQLTDRSSIAANVPIELLFEIQPTTINRDVKARVQKQKKNFQKNAESLNNITVFVVQKDLVIETPHGDITVPQGYSVGDGNTRLEWWLQEHAAGRLDPNRTVSVQFVRIDTAEDYTLEYYSYDSTDAVETTANKITGALSALGLDLRTNKGKRGQFGSSLNYAYAGDRRDDALSKIKYFRDEIRLVDRYLLNVDDKSLRQQTSTLVSAFLIALKVYNEPAEQRQVLISMMKKLNEITDRDWQIQTHPGNPDPHNRIDGAQLIMREALYFEYTEKGTRRADYENTVTFYLYCIDLWMQNKFVSNRKGALKTGSWVDCYREAIDFLYERDFD